jgi:16S rRNA (cytosine967-C5)-methyltransferase
MSESTEDLLESNNRAAKVSLVALPGFCSVEELRGADESPQQSPLGAEITGSPSNLEAVRLGFARVQDQGSQLVTLALTSASVIGSDNRWLDMCAGPGGKAALMAAISKERTIEFVSNEVSEHRARLVSASLAPLGSFKTTVEDGRRIGEGSQSYTRILLDAPCTGLGALRRRPESRWRKSVEDLVSLVTLQRELLESAWKALAPGGVLAYVTCSPHLSETTAQVAWAQNKFGKELELLPANEILNSISPSLVLDESVKTSQLWPHLHGTDAMFLALFRKAVN